MSRLALITNTNKDPGLKITKEVSEILKKKYEVVEFLINEGANSDDICKDADAAVVLGGDGTILNAAALSSRHNVPILGINLGNLGFLADIEKDKIKSDLEEFVNGNYRCEERFMIDGCVITQTGDKKTFTALNDIVVSRASYKRMVAFDAFVNGDRLASYEGDGIVVATPTGSTAYSMSAGGPIIDPSLDVCVITPVCPHTMSSKPVIVPGSAEIEIRFKNKFNDMATLTSDGRDAVRLCDGDVIKIKGSEKKVTLIRVSDISFYELLHYKLQG